MLTSSERHRVARLASTTEVAELMHVSPRTVQRWIASGLLPSVSVGRTRRVTRDGLRKFIQQSEARSRTNRLIRMTKQQLRRLLCERLGVSLRTLERWEHGEDGIRPKVAAALLRELYRLLT